MDYEKYMKVTKIEEIGEGMRVCLDFVDILKPSDGVFVGNTGHGYIKVLAENRESEGYPARPFRINAGALHQYVRQGEQTKYLHECQAGEEVSVTDGEKERMIALGRVKIEKRPLLRVECTDGEKLISATLQKSASVYVNEKEKGECPLLELKTGQEILAVSDEPGRHLGTKVDEEIIER
ncbi:3-dehydroquinate synthase II [Salimicrobium salexigens]|uniref:3-dehydroquinate synthase II n=1 Tax=Salimicrobium salexigens TaxID=908941 RepID=A0ABY1KX86_9BACI|nr:3-dehydroquinate synthase II [Salimicrobium salexigens]SIS75837.1 3-dehydroquinate synthase II [Salimicrobium salexigens]